MIFIAIGNGFDLAHGMNTKYSHFIHHILEYADANDDKYDELTRRNQNYVDDRRSKYIKYFHKNDFFASLVDKKGRNGFAENILRDGRENWSDIEQVYFEQLLKVNSAKILNNQFETIKLFFEDYISIQKCGKLSSYETFFKRLPQFVSINFNYTQTLAKYRLDHVINLHGQYGSEINPIIFGYAANHDVTQELMQKHKTIDGLKNIKSFNYNQSNEYSKLQSLLDKYKGDYNEFWVLGHSCGLSDHSILQEIIENESIKKIRLFNYNGRDTYKQKQFNLYQISHPKLVLEKLLNFNLSMNMPQKKELDLAFLDHIVKEYESNLSSFKGLY